jgi:hypothetical protein
MPHLLEAQGLHKAFGDVVAVDRLSPCAIVGCRAVA